ncbi:hypothetical protein HYT01_02270 [Candidatus Giovannonibacteria bacterium]|nr:hypothetical protein [Candidatus Giovannonibacteria bacterium]
MITVVSLAGATIYYIKTNQNTDSFLLPKTTDEAIPLIEKCVVKSVRFYNSETVIYFIDGRSVRLAKKISSVQELSKVVIAASKKCNINISLLIQ